MRILLREVPVSENAERGRRLGELSDLDPRLAPGKERGKEGPRLLCSLMKTQQSCQGVLQPKLAARGV